MSWINVANALAFIALAAVSLGLVLHKDRQTHARAVFDQVLGDGAYSVVSSGKSQDFWSACIGAVVSFNGSVEDLQQPPQSFDGDQPWSYDFSGEWQATPVDPATLHLCQQHFNHFAPPVADTLFAAANSDSAWYANPRSDTFLLWAPEQGLAARIYFGD